MENPTKSVSTIASPKFKNLWENLCIKIEKYMQEKNFCGVIDTYRLLLEQIHFERKNNRLSCQTELKLKEKCLSKYAKLIDDSKGINNYSEISRGLTIACSNKNTLWKSTLQTSSDDELLELIAPNQSKTSHVNFCDSALKLHSIKSQTQDRYIGIDTFWKRISNVIYNGRTLGLAGNTMDFNSRNSTIVNVQGKNLTSSKELHKFDKSYKRKPNELSLKSTGCEPKKLCPYEPKLFVENHERINATLKRKRQNQLADGNLSSENCKLNSPDNLFKTARQVMESKQRNDQKSQPSNSRKCLGGTRRGPSSKFVAPMQNSNTDKREDNETAEEIVDERLKNIDPKMVKIMLNEIMDHGSPVHWDDIAGLEFAKKTMKEIVVWPLLRPDIFKGLRGPPKGILLFGPPGTGKTLIGKCIASQSKSTFFCISASSLGSKWVGEGEKLVRALFAVARCYQPAVIFIDEIDSLLTQRSGTEHESSRRLKTEFLVQFDGVNTANDERLLVMGATNRPQELDEAARRRLVKRLYIPLPESHARRQIVKSLLNDHSHQLSERDLDTICNKSDGYSGADMTNLCKEAALGPIRSIKFDQIEFITSDQVRPIVLSDFMDALKQVRASVSDTDLDMYAKWNQTYGSG